MEITYRVYKPRRARESPPFRLVEQHLEEPLTRLVEGHAISPELAKKLLAWKHPGFSAHVGEPIAPTDKLRLEDTAAKVFHVDRLSRRERPERRGAGSVDFVVPAAPVAQAAVGSADQEDYRSPAPPRGNPESSPARQGDPAPP